MPVNVFVLGKIAKLGKIMVILKPPFRQLL